jgi:hypothetical protein
MSELRKLQNDYYAGRKRELDALAAWQSASVGTTLSGQGLSQSAIASTIDWVDKNWQARYNNLMKEHIDTLKWLQDSEQNFMNWYWTLMWNLSSAEQWALKGWLNSFNDLRKNLDDTYYKAIDERYNPYEVLTQAKVTGASEVAQSTGKREDVEAAYKKTDIDNRVKLLNAYLKTYFWGEVDASKFIPYLKQAAQQNDMTAAMQFLADATKTPVVSQWPIINRWGGDEDEKPWWTLWIPTFWGVHIFLTNFDHSPKTSHHSSFLI